MLGCECKPFSDLSPFCACFVRVEGGFFVVWGVFRVGGWDGIVLYMVFSFGVGYV